MTERDDPTAEIAADAADNNDGSQPPARPGDPDWHGVATTPEIQKLGGAEPQAQWHGVSAEPKHSPADDERGTDR